MPLGKRKIDLPAQSNFHLTFSPKMSAGIVSNIRTTLEMIKIEHTLFALPFAFLGAVLAANGLPSLKQVLWITVAMVGARSTAMAFNRIADREYDALNPRTASRALPAGLLSVAFVSGFTLVSATLFFIASAMLNRLTLMLAPVALASVLLYSFSKRWTLLSHLLLGWCLAIAPTGAWIAVRGALDSAVPILLSLVVLFWTAGFDVLYACQDLEYDRSVNLFSVPKRFGIANALFIARIMHVGVVALLAWLALSFALPWPAWVGIAVVAALLAYEHSLVKADDLSKLDAAFFAVNGYISMLFLLFWGAAAAVWRV